MSQHYTPAATNYLQGVVPPRAVSRTNADLAPGFAPSWIILQRVAWERVLLTRLVIDGVECPLLPTQEGEQMVYPLPVWSPEQLQRVRRIELTWSNKTSHGAHFSYLVTDMKPVQPTVGYAQPSATILGPAVGMTTPMNLPAQAQPVRMAPMSPPAFPLPPTGSPMLGGSPQPMAAQPMSAPAIPAPALPVAAPPPSPPQPPPTPAEGHVADCLRVDYLLVRKLAEGLGARFGMMPDTLLNAYVENFGSAGLELVPRQWVEEARTRAGQTGMDQAQLIAGIVLQRLAERLQEDREFQELNRPGAAARVLSSPQAGGPDFIVKTSTPAPASDEKAPDTSPTGAAPRPTGEALQALAALFLVKASWLLLVLKTIADARGLNPDLLFHAINGGVSLSPRRLIALLRDRYLAEAKADVEKKLGEAAALEDTPAVDPKELERLVNEAVATRSVDHVARGIAGGCSVPEPDPTEVPPAVE